MSYNDLSFEPSRIGGGFFAMHHFSDGKTAYIHADELTPDGANYRLCVLSSQGRHLYQMSNLDREQLLVKLNRFEFFS